MQEVVSERVLGYLMRLVKGQELLLDKHVERLRHFHSLVLCILAEAHFVDLILSGRFGRAVEEFGDAEEKLDKHEPADALRRIHKPLVYLLLEAIREFALGHEHLELGHVEDAGVEDVELLDERLPERVVVDPRVQLRPTLQPVVRLAYHLVVDLRVLKQHLLLRLIIVGDLAQFDPAHIFFHADSHVF